MLAVRLQRLSFLWFSRPPCRLSPCQQVRCARARPPGWRSGLVVGVEAVAVGRQHEAVSIDIAGGELQLGLHELLHLPFVGAAIPSHAEQATGTPVADQIGLGQAGIIGDAKPLGRAAVTLLDLGAVLERLVVRVFRRRQHADDRTLLVFRQRWIAIRTLVELPSVVLATLRRRGW